MLNPVYQAKPCWMLKYWPFNMLNEIERGNKNELYFAVHILKRLLLNKLLHGVEPYVISFS